MGSVTGSGTGGLVDALNLTVRGPPSPYRPVFCSSFLLFSVHAVIYIPSLQIELVQHNAISSKQIYFQTAHDSRASAPVLSQLGSPGDHVPRSPLVFLTYNYRLDAARALEPEPPPPSFSIQMIPPLAAGNRRETTWHTPAVGRFRRQHRLHTFVYKRTHTHTYTRASQIATLCRPQHHPNTTNTTTAIIFKTRPIYIFLYYWAV